MRRCTRCILPETFPGINFDSEGICQYCRALPPQEERQAQKQQLQTQFELIADQVRDHPGYHCLVAWSGGRDSTHALCILKQHYNLNILAFTFDTGFVSDLALKNIRLVSERLNLDHIIVKPRFDLIKELFSTALNTPRDSSPTWNAVSNLCLTHETLTKGIGLRIALELEIPMVAYGWLPGQLPSFHGFPPTNLQAFKESIKQDKTALRKIIGLQADAYFPRAQTLKTVYQIPHVVAPLFFMAKNEPTTLRCIQASGWEPPANNHLDGANCLLHEFAIQLHLQQTGYHPQLEFLANLVREAYLTREEALSRITAPVAPEVLQAVRAKLGFSPLYFAQLMSYKHLPT